MGDRFHHRFLVGAHVGTSFALEPLRHHVPDHLIYCSRPLIGQDVRQLVDDDDIATFQQDVLPKLELRFEELGADLRVTLCAT